MKNSLLLISLVTVGVTLAVSGCSRKSDAKSELEKAESALAKPEAGQPASAQPVPAPQSPAASTPTPPTQPAAPPAQQMTAAIAAYKSGKLDEAVTRLQKLRATPALSPEQRIALNDAMAAVMAEIYALAAKGDSRAAQAVKQYEQMQTQRR